MEVRGVRSSWETFWKKVSCFCFASRRSPAIRFIESARASNSTSRKVSSRGDRLPPPISSAKADRLCTGSEKERAKYLLSRTDSSTAARITKSSTRWIRLVRAVREVTST